MARSLLEQLTQIRRSRTYDDAVSDVNTSAVAEPTVSGSLQDDLNVVRTLMKELKGSTNWFDDLGAADITTNAADIATNVSDISTNASDISTNAGDITTNASGIATNAAGIATNVSDISTNASDISTNAGDITNLESAVGSSTGTAGLNYSSNHFVTDATSLETAIGVLDNAIDLAAGDKYIESVAGTITKNTLHTLPYSITYTPYAIAGQEGRNMDVYVSGQLLAADTGSSGAGADRDYGETTASGITFRFTIPVGSNITYIIRQ